MNELIKINYEKGKPTASARELWEFLGSPYGKFTDWFNQYKEYGFTENEDYIGFSEISDKPQGGRPTQDYEITVDMAKELAMLQKSEKGSQARKYFIDVEKQFKEAINKPMTQLEIIAAMATNMVTFEKKLGETEIIANRTSRMVETALDALSAPPDTDWQIATGDKIKGMAQNYTLSYVVLFGDLYKEIEDMAHVNLNARVSGLQRRLKQEGATYKKRQAVTKLHVISLDPTLKLAFDGIVRRYNARYATDKISQFTQVM